MLLWDGLCTIMETSILEVRICMVMLGIHWGHMHNSSMLCISFFFVFLWLFIIILCDGLCTIWKQLLWKSEFGFVHSFWFLVIIGSVYQNIQRNWRNIRKHGFTFLYALIITMPTCVLRYFKNCGINGVSNIKYLLYLVL